jgi:hypothetical protein
LGGGGGWYHYNQSRYCQHTLRPYYWFLVPIIMILLLNSWKKIQKHSHITLTLGWLSHIMCSFIMANSLQCYICHYTITGTDGIHNQMLSHLPATEVFLLSMYNHTWSENLVPVVSIVATIVPILQASKDSSLPISYKHHQFHYFFF